MDWYVPPYNEHAREEAVEEHRKEYEHEQAVEKQWQESADNDPQCAACGVHLSEHALCGCLDGFMSRAPFHDQVGVLDPNSLEGERFFLCGPDEEDDEEAQA